MILSGICLSDDGAFISMNGDCRYPAVATEENSIYLVWLFTKVRPRDLYFQRSIDEGRTWEGARRISRENGDCLPPSIAVNSGIIHLAWIDCGEVIDGAMYYTRSFDGGDNWEKHRVLVGNTNSAMSPSFACAGSNVYLLWEDVETNFFFKASRDRGLTWENEMLLGKVGKHSCYCLPPALLVNGNELVVVWSDFRKKKKHLNLRVFSKGHRDEWFFYIICRKSTNNGRTWSKEHILTSAEVSKELQGKIDNPTMFSDGSRSYLFWVDKHNSPLGEILYTVFDPSKENDQVTGKMLYPTPKRSPSCPSVVFDNNRNLHFTWVSTFSWESIIHYGSLDPAGNILKEKKDLTSNGDRYYNPIIIKTTSGLLHIFWFNEPFKDEDEHARIFLKTSSDNGLTWESRKSQTKDGRN